jgi:NAD dependent epimerase/dehydratase
LNTNKPTRIDGAKALVTGAGGFIGSHLVEALGSKGAEVTALVHYDARPGLSNLDLIDAKVLSATKVIAGNIEDPHFVRQVVPGHRFVFHLAALIPIPYSYIAPASYLRTNIEGTLNVLEACRLSPSTRLINVSTSETYGTARYVPINEEHPLQAQSPYAATKIAAEKLTESYSKSFGVLATTVKPFNTYGPRQSARAIVPTIVTQAISQPQLRLGSTSPIRDLTFVEDTVSGLLAIAECDDAIGQTLNLGTGEAVSVAQLVQLVFDIIGTSKPVLEEAARVRPASSEVLRLVCDAQRVRSLTGWQPRVQLREGLTRTIQFVRENPSLFRPDRYNV